MVIDVKSDGFRVEEGYDERKTRIHFGGKRETVESSVLFTDSEVPTYTAPWVPVNYKDGNCGQTVGRT